MVFRDPEGWDGFQRPRVAKVTLECRVEISPCFPKTTKEAGPPWSCCFRAVWRTEQLCVLFKGALLYWFMPNNLNLMPLQGVYIFLSQLIAWMGILVQHLLSCLGLNTVV